MQLQVQILNLNQIGNNLVSHNEWIWIQSKTVCYCVSVSFFENGHFCPSAIVDLIGGEISCVGETVNTDFHWMQNVPLGSK